MNPEPILRLHEASKFFGGIVALDHLNLTAQHGQVIGIVGPNSSGKTTLLDAINGIQQIDVGEIYFSGQRITHQAIYKRTRMGITRTFKLPRLFPHLGIVDHLLMCQSEHFPRFWHTFVRHPMPKNDSAQQLIDNLQLTAFLEIAVSELPLERQKCLELGMAIIAAPQLVLLDEITAGCSDPMQAFIQEQILALKQQQAMTILLVEHNLQLARAVCDWMLVMNYGQIVAQGTPDEILTDEILLQTFFTM